MGHIEKQSIARVSPYDQTNGFLISAIMIVGFLVTVLFVIWCTLEFRVTRVQPKPLEPGKFFKVSLDEKHSEFAELPPAAALKFADDLVLVTEAVSAIKANELIKTDFKSVVDSQGLREVGPPGFGGGVEPGDDRPIDPRPDHDRWSVRYENLSFAQYRQVLGLFEIEIGVVRLNHNQIVRIRLDGDDTRVSPTDRAAEKYSIYFQNARSIARRWDQNIARDQNIEVSDSAVVHFYPVEVIDTLRALEADQISYGERQVSDVLETQFKIVQTETGFEFAVDKIKFR